ncbi:MAG TPA: RICIN domain-containing protein [Candidatus Saccharimonadia bacterium]|nr:RICIN domain-containing protein [Candidatus Saccharimonadia bacterium]
MKTLAIIFGVAFILMTRVHALEDGFYYYLSVEFEGEERVLDIQNDGENTPIILSKKSSEPTQLWRLTDNHEGYYRLTTMWLGVSYSLDIVNDGQDNNRIVINKSADYSGQLWRITPLAGDAYRLTSQWRGSKFSLAASRDAASKTTVPMLVPTGDAPGQLWKITKSEKKVK